MEQLVTIRRANGNDYIPVTTLLLSENLPAEDIAAALPHFMVAEEHGTITGSAGLECYGDVALLRSVAVHTSQRNKGLAAQLLQALLEYAREAGIKKIFLLTNTAENYFERKGFERVEREIVPAAVLQSKEFNGLCPSSAVIMYLSL